jgi:hypothetical protein
MASWEEFSRIVTEAKASKKLDPVGQEDDDVDNDGDSDSSDSYLKKRRATVGAAIAADKKKKVEEALDPVGQEDKDIDNDGDHDKSDKYLLNRRKVRAKVIPPQERLKTDRDMFNIPKSEQEAARERTLAKAKAKREKMKEDVEQIDEIAPLVAGGLALGGALAAGSAIKRAQDAAKSGVNAANKGKNIKNPGTGIAGAAYGMQKRNNALNDAMKQLRQSYQPEGEMVEEDKEYRREMAKAAARERAEEKKAETEFRSRGRSSEKKKGPKLSTTPEAKSVVKNYVDQEMGKIKYMDKLTKKNKNPIGLVTKEEVEQLDEMPYQVYGSHDGKTEKKIGKPVKSRKYAHDRADELSDTHKETGGKFRVQKEEVETIEEKALSRAQQRFMGMVYAAKKGGTPASPEVAKAAEGMTKKAARDFAKTKHEGLPEKKEETKEEVSIVDRILDEAIKGTIPGGKSKLQKYKVQAKGVRTAQMASAALSGDDEELKKLKGAKTTVKIKNDSPESSEPESEQQNTGKPKPGRGLSDTSAYVRGKIIQGATDIKKEKLKTARYDKRRADTLEDRKQKALKEKEKERKQAEEDKKKAKKDARQKLKQDIQSAWNEPVKVSSSEKDTDVASSLMSNVGSLAGGVAKTGIAVGKYGVRRALAKRQERKQKQSENQNEQFSNWREEFIFEVDDQSVQNEKQKVIDVSKKKNKIEINPNMSEGCGCDEKEKEETPKKDMRDLPTKVNLLKTKARSMGVRNPLVMVASEETDNIQEVAPLLAGLARVAGGTVARGVTSRVAGTAAKGSLRSRAAEIIGQKAGERIENMFTNQPASANGDEPIFQTKLEKQLKTEGAAWTKKEGKSEAGGLNEKGRKSYERENPGSDLKAPSKKVGNPRRASFCARMSGMKAKLTSKKTANDPDSRINKSLRAWNC